MERPVVIADAPGGLADALVASLDDRGIDVESVDGDDVPGALADVEVVITFDLTADHLDSAPALRWVQAMSAGVDRYPLDALADRDVALTNASGVHAEPAGEQVLGMMLAVERKLHRAIRQQARGEWDRYRGGELRGKTLGVVGLGAIGTRVAELGDAVGMTVIGTKRDPSDAPDAVSEVYDPSGIHHVLERSDYLALACPLTEDTRGLIGHEELATLGSDGVLVNVARGGIVDQEALVAALREGTIRAAALDVYAEEPLPEASPLWSMDDAVLTPHVAGTTPEYATRLADIVAENLGRYREEGADALTNRVV